MQQWHCWRTVRLQRPSWEAVRRGSEGCCTGGKVGDGEGGSHWFSRVMVGPVSQAHVVQFGAYMYVLPSCRQTVHHMPAPQSLYGYQITSTLQIGDPSIIANECGITTVGDFRLADMAVGGQGAPLVPYLDQTLLERYYRERKRAGMLLNIGGISNISAYVPPSKAFCVVFY